MREEPQPGERNGLLDSGLGLERRFRWALVLYAVLAGLVWFTIGTGKVFVLGKPVEIRLIPLVVIGAMVLRTVLARQAERIRRGGDGGER